MKTLIAIPAMDQNEARFTQALATLQKPEGDTVVAMQIGSLVYTSRNDLARRALADDVDYVFWLDSDMVFPPDVLVRMMAQMKEDDIDILTGLYCRRVEPYTPTIFTKLEMDGGLCRFKELDEIPSERFECAGMGFGCVLMSAQVIMDVMGYYGDAFSPIAGVGEDLSFCWRARQRGYKIYCDPTIPLGHIGRIVITRQFFEAYKGGRGGNA